MNTQRRAVLEADVCWLISIMFLCYRAARRKLEECAKKTKRESTCAWKTVGARKHKAARHLRARVLTDACRAEWGWGGGGGSRGLRLVTSKGNKAGIQMSVGYTGLAFNFLYFLFFFFFFFKVTAVCLNPAGGMKKEPKTKHLSHCKAR